MLVVTDPVFVYTHTCRAETILSGVIVRPDADDPNSSKMTVLLQNDIKGWIPHFIVNAFASSAPAAWRDDMANYYHQHYSKRGCKESGEAVGGEGQTEGVKEEKEY